METVSFRPYYLPFVCEYAHILLQLLLSNLWVFDTRYFLKSYLYNSFITIIGIRYLKDVKFVIEFSNNYNYNFKIDFMSGVASVIIFDKKIPKQVQFFELKISFENCKAFNSVSRNYKLLHPTERPNNFWEVYHGFYEKHKKNVPFFYHFNKRISNFSREFISFYVNEDCIAMITKQLY